MIADSYSQGLAGSNSTIAITNQITVLMYQLGWLLAKVQSLFILNVRLWILNVFFVRCTWHPVDSSVHILSKLIYELVPKVFKATLSFIEKWPMHGSGLTSLDEKWCKACGTHWRKTKEEKKAKAIRPCSELKQKTESHSAILEKHKWELQEVQSEEIERNTVRVWESEKKKMRHFSLLKLHIRKINWWSSYGVFERYNHRELEYSKAYFAIGFVVRLYLLLEIYLSYIQFIVVTSLA